MGAIGGGATVCRSPNDVPTHASIYISTGITMGPP